MDTQHAEQWLQSVRAHAPRFLDRIIDDNHPGFAHFTPAHDLYPASLHWGLNNAVYVLKIIHTLGLQKQYEKACQDMYAYILSFENADGIFTDRFLDAVAYPFRRVSAIRSRTPYRVVRGDIHRAQTRQALSVLSMYDVLPKHRVDPFIHIGENNANTFFDTLDWAKPWHAGSHVSHAFFFLAQQETEETKAFRAELIERLASIQDTATGAWFVGNPEPQEVINGIMKVLTGFHVIGYESFDRKEQLIDTCLAAESQQHACDHFNTVYALSRLLQLTSTGYKAKEIRDLLQKKLAAYKSFYRENDGGFSFHETTSSRGYYQAPVARTSSGADIHGTTMFLWGVAMIAHALALPSYQEFHPFIP